MATRSNNESAGSITALFDEGARLFDNMGSPMEQTPHKAGKTPTTPTRVADLAAAVDGGSGIQHNYSLSSQGRPVSSIYAGVGVTPQRKGRVNMQGKMATLPLTCRE